MPFPIVITIIPPLVKAAVALAGVAVTLYATSKPKVDGKFLLIGPGLSGKSTFVHYLEHGRYPKVGFNTGFSKPHDINLILSNGRKVSITVIDQKGTRPFIDGKKDREQWKSGLRDIGKGGVVLYVVSSECLSGANMHIANEDVKWLKEHLDARPVRIIITHLDKFPMPDYAAFAQFNHLKAEELWRGNLLEESEMIDLTNKFKNLVEEIST